MNKTVIVIILATLLLIVGGMLFFSNKQNSSSTPPPLPSNLEYFWGNGCPHCANVEEFLKTWDPPIGEASKKDQVKIDKFEVWSNPKNAALMEARYNYCQTPRAEMGVPLLFTPEGKCLVGDQPIIDHFKEL